ncbi:Argonaute/Dicer protein, PAZ [Artemisia annua]|uniref:Argonaute/Dicer protein, PAZ n=1 Tax=Artemisia annua TaxID=35608 RepID=A0A2U1M028_ARTAN|nr:Argonaute/Dicer protein, PAZ [Artemisia annua]
MSGHGGQTTASPPVNAPPVKELEKLSLVTPPPPLTVPLVPSAVKKLRTPARSGFGSVGRKVFIKANHFLVSVGNRDPHQYDMLRSTVTDLAISIYFFGLGGSTVLGSKKQVTQISCFNTDLGRKLKRGKIRGFF